MERGKSKQEIQEEIERARRKFMSTGRRPMRLAPDDQDRAANVKPRRQRLKMYG